MAWKRVLNIDNDDAKCGATRRSLEAAGFHVEDVAFGQMAPEEVVRRYFSDGPLLILLWRCLPDLNPVEFRHAIEASGTLVLYFFSPGAASASQASAAESFADVCLPEPGSDAELVATVKAFTRVLERQAGDRQRIAKLEAGVLEQLHDGVICFDRQWRYVYVNTRGAALTGHRPEELLGRCVWEVFPAAVGGDFFRLVHHVMDEQRALDQTCYDERVSQRVHYHCYPSAEGGVIISVDNTACYETLEALRERDERLRAAVEAAEVGTWWINFKTGLESRDANLNRILGLTPEPSAVPVKTSAPRIHPDDRPRVEAAFHRLIAAGEKYVEEFRVIRPDGAIHWVRDQGRRICDAAGQPLYAAGALVDITEHKRAREELNRRLAEIEAIYNTAPVGLCVFDPELHYRRINQRLAELNGLSVDQHLGRSIRECVPDLADRFEPVIRHVLATREPVLDLEVSREAARPFGAVHHWVTHWYPLIDEDIICGVNVVVEEVSERRRAEEALAYEKSLLDTLLTAAPIGLGFMDREFRFVRINRALAEINGLPAAAHLGRSLEETVPEAWPQVKPILRTVMEKDEPVTDMEILMETRAYPGVKRHYLANFYPVHMAKAITGIGMVVMDIHERKSAEAALQEADRRKDEFLAMLGHELRNPLAPIRNAVQILGKLARQDPTLEWACGLINRQVVHLVRLIDDLLDVSRVVRGKILLQTERLNLDEVIEHAVELSRDVIESHHHELRLSLPQEHLQVQGDHTRLVQIVENLLTNAAKYTSEGGRIELDLARENGAAVIRVRDTGMGIGPDLLPRVFDLFTQGQQELDRPTGGLGIGLTVVKGLVQLHGGQVEARSEGLGKGSEFTIRLSLSAETPDPSSP